MIANEIDVRDVLVDAAPDVTVHEIVKRVRTIRDVVRDLRESRRVRRRP